MSRFSWWSLLLLSLLIVGCGSAVSGSKRIEGGSITDAGLSRDAAGSAMFFKIPSKGGSEFFGVDFRGSVSTGSLSVQALNPDGKLI